MDRQGKRYFSATLSVREQVLRLHATVQSQVKDAASAMAQTLPAVCFPLSLLYLAGYQREAIAAIPDTPGPCPQGSE